MKTIVIPASCGETCLNHLKYALKYFSADEITCIFLQVRPIPDNYNDMMTLHKNMGRYQFFDDNFRDNVAILKQQVGARLLVKTDHVYGDSAVVFRNYIKHLGANIIIYDKEQLEDNRIKTGLNIFRMLNRCRCELLEIPKNISVREMVDLTKRQNTYAPESVMYSYNTVEKQLSELQEVLLKN